MKCRVADVIFNILVSNGITDCFAVVGGGAMHLDNALALNDKIHKYFNHHEQACAMAAEAYARLSGKMAVVCVTSGPGATNTLTGVVGAWQDSLPMLILSGQVRYDVSVAKSGLPLRYRGIQEFDIVPVVRHMTKYAVMITDPLCIKREIYKALSIALEGRRGPVWIDIPQDIQSAIIETDELYPLDIMDRCEQKVDYTKAVSLLQQAKRPCILAGSGIRSGDVMSEFLAFVDAADIPVVGGSWVSDNMYLEHPLFFGLSGNVGPRTGNFILQNADVILVLGNSLGFRQTGFNQEGFAPNARIIMVDADENEAKKPGLRIEEFIHQDLAVFLGTYQDWFPQMDIDEKWLDYCRKLKERFDVYETAKNIQMDERVCSYYFWKMFEKYEPDDSILALGNNTACTVKLQVGVRKKCQRVITNYTCGSMGYDIPAAIGAAIASKRTIYCITGDGSIMMNLQELQTIVHYNLPVHIVVFSNGGYAAIRQTGKAFFNGVYIGCTPETGISFPDFRKIADTFGFKYLRCQCNAEIAGCLQDMFLSKDRVFLEIEQLYDNPVIPKTMSRLDENGNMHAAVLHDMAPFLSREEMEELMFEN